MQGYHRGQDTQCDDASLRNTDGNAAEMGWITSTRCFAITLCPDRAQHVAAGENKFFELHERINVRIGHIFPP